MKIYTSDGHLLDVKKMRGSIGLEAVAKVLEDCVITVEDIRKIREAVMGDEGYCPVCEKWVEAVWITEDHVEIAICGACYSTLQQVRYREAI